MLDIPAIRNPIIKGLHTALTRPVIRADQDGHIPDYPFVTYSLTSPYIDQYGQDIDVYTAAGRERTKHIEIVASFSVYSEDEDEATTLCMRLIEHFERLTRNDLRDIGIVVVSCSDVQNRSVLLVEHYERRFGVDVRFRVIDRLFEPYPADGAGYIERAEITKEG